MLVVTTTVRMVYGIHSNTSNLGESLALSFVFMEHPKKTLPTMTQSKIPSFTMKDVVSFLSMGKQVISLLMITVLVSMELKEKKEPLKTQKMVIFQKIQLNMGTLIRHSHYQ